MSGLLHVRSRSLQSGSHHRDRWRGGKRWGEGGRGERVRSLPSGSHHRDGTVYARGIAGTRARSVPLGSVSTTKVVRFGSATVRLTCLVTNSTVIAPASAVVLLQRQENHTGVTGKKEVVGSVGEMDWWPDTNNGAGREASGRSRDHHTEKQAHLMLSMLVLTRCTCSAAGTSA